MSLEEIQTAYVSALDMEEPNRTKQLSSLMDVLEKEHRTFIINPTDYDLEKPDVILYREISMARNFD